jgi:hypothetical protein
LWVVAHNDGYEKVGGKFLSSAFFAISNLLGFENLTGLTTRSTCAESQPQPSLAFSERSDGSVSSLRRTPQSSPWL